MPVSGVPEASANNKTLPPGLTETLCCTAVTVTSGREKNRQADQPATPNRTSSNTIRISGPLLLLTGALKIWSLVSESRGAAIVGVVEIVAVWFAAVGVPHFSQNFEPGSKALPQAAQTGVVAAATAGGADNGSGSFCAGEGGGGTMAASVADGCGMAGSGAGEMLKGGSSDGLATGADAAAVSFTTGAPAAMIEGSGAQPGFSRISRKNGCRAWPWLRRRSRSIHWRHCRQSFGRSPGRIC